MCVTICRNNNCTHRSDSNHLSTTIWARLPLELIREIFSLLAMSSSQKARQLRLVSSDINILVLPLLFRHIDIIKPDDVHHLTTVLLPKRKNHVPALKSRLHIMPRPLASYTVQSCALVINDRRPSLEEALAKIAPVLCSISKLAITARNLQAHGYWLRQHPIRPKFIMIVHYGSPYIVNYRDSIFENVTHLYTSIINGHRNSSVADLPMLSHLAVSTRHNLPITSANIIAASLRRILEQCEKLQMLVLVLDFGSEFLSDLDLITAWDLRLDDCFLDDRFILLPDFRSPRWEWDDIVQNSYSSLFCPTNVKESPPNHETIWNRAERWQKSVKTRGSPKISKNRTLRFLYMRHTRLQSATIPSDCRGVEWEIDMVERDNYRHPKPFDPELELDSLYGFQSAFG